MARSVVPILMFSPEIYTHSKSSKKAVIVEADSATCFCFAPGSVGVISTPTEFNWLSRAWSS